MLLVDPTKSFSQPKGLRILTAFPQCRFPSPTVSIELETSKLANTLP